FSFGFNGAGTTNTSTTSQRLTSGMFHNTLSTASSGDIWAWDSPNPPQGFTSYGEFNSWIADFLDYDVRHVTSNWGCLDNNDFVGNDGSNMNDAISSINLAANQSATFSKHCSTGGTSNFTIKFINQSGDNFIPFDDFNPSNKISSMTMSWDGTLATNNNAPAPSTSAVSSQLGDWLTFPGSLNGNWNQAGVPTTWNKDYENAAVYKIVVDEFGLSNALLTISADDGAFVWLDGDYVGGAVNASGTNQSYNLGNDLDEGTHYLQILRTATASTASPDWTINLTAENFGGVDTHHPGPPDRGNHFFYGANNNDFTVSQIIDVSDGKAQIDDGNATYNLAAYLGGHEAQNDRARVKITFLKNNNTDLGTAQVGYLSASDRDDQTGLFKDTAQGSVPPNTRKIKVEVTLDRKTSTRNDAYVDSISLVLSANGEANFTDPGVLDTHTATINWGDGTGTNAGAVAESGGNGAVQGSHIYADNRTSGDQKYTVTVGVTDKDSDSTSDTFKVQVLNVVPDVTPVEATFTNQINQTRQIATFSDPGFGDTHTATIDWGDGGTSNGTIIESNGAGSVSGSHKFQLGGSFPTARDITVCVTDDDGGTTCVANTVTVVNMVIKNINAGNNKTKTEGSSVSFSGSFGVLDDPSQATVPAHNFTYQWDFGDGSSTSVQSKSSSGNVSANHTYTDNGVYVTKLLVTAIGTNPVKILAGGEDQAKVTINNANPSISGYSNKTKDEGETLNIFNLGFTDSGSDDTHTATVAWGDGAVTTATVNQNTNKISDSHAYADNGSYSGVITVTDDDGGSDTEAFTVTVNNQNPDAQIEADSAAQEGGSFTVRMINPSDPSSVDTAAGFTYAFNCADGAGFSAYSTTSSIQCVANDDGTRNVTGRVKDRDGGYGQRSSLVTVLGVAPTANLIAPTEVGEGSTVWFSLASAYDPSEVDTLAGFFYRFSCDGGTTFSNLDASNTSSCDTDNGNSTLSIVAEVSDEDGQSTAYPASVTVNNVPPSGTFNAPTLVDEGTVYTLAMTDVSDPSDADTTAGFEYRFKCDSAPFTTFGSLAEAECTAGNDGVYLVTGEASDVGPGLPRVSTYSTSVTVVNVAPVIDDIANVTVNEGSSLSLLGSFTDPGPDTWTATVDYGDGTGEQALALSGRNFTLAHTYPAFGTYVAVVTVDDGDFSDDSEAFTVSVTNVSPVTTINGVTGGHLAGIDEGDLLVASGQFTDPGDNSWTATVNYGDGTPTASLSLNVDKTFDLEHVYADNGSYDVIVCVTDNGGALGCDWVIQDVTNTDPTVEPGEDQIVTEGELVSLNPADFHDQGSADTHTATIDWGDGEPIDDGVVTETPSGPPGSVTGADGNVAGSHVYVDNGEYTVEVCVTDDDLATVCDELTVTVQNANPSVNIGEDITISEGLVLDPDDSFTDASVVDTHSGAIDWGDGTSEPAVVVQGAGSGSTTSSHQYLVAGIYSVELCITDDDTGIGCDSLTLEVISATEATARFAGFLASLDLPEGTKNSLLAKLNGAMESFEQGDDKEGINRLAAFINAVEAQTGKKISEEDAEVLLSSAQQIIDGVLGQGEVTQPGSGGQDNGNGQSNGKGGKK
nr:PKD domain-containing protein [Chloroflexota bacterium]